LTVHWSLRNSAISVGFQLLLQGKVLMISTVM